MTRYRIPARVAYEPDTIANPARMVIAHVPAGTPLILMGSGAAIFDTLVDEPELDEVIHILEDAYAAPPGSLRDEIERFVVDLADRGYLVEERDTDAAGDSE